MTYTLKVLRRHHDTKMRYVEDLTLARHEIIGYQPHFDISMVLVKHRGQYMQFMCENSYNELKHEIGIPDNIFKVDLI